MLNIFVYFLLFPLGDHSDRMKDLFFACSTLLIPRNRLPRENAFYQSLAYELICGDLIPRRFVPDAAHAKLRKYRNAVDHREKLRQEMRNMNVIPPLEWPVWGHRGIYPFINVCYGPDYPDLYFEPLFHLKDRWEAVRQSIVNMGGIRSFLLHEAWAPFFKIVFDMMRQEHVNWNEIDKVDKHCATCRCERVVEEMIHR
jgi:hypothetical protein